MTDTPRPSRRALLAGGPLAALALAAPRRAAAEDAPPAIEPFYGPHQSGILTPSQTHTYFAAFDLTTDSRDDVIALLRAWTDAAAQLTRGAPARPFGADLDAPAGDSADTIGLPAARLTLTFGFGPGLFTKEGKDRYGLAAKRPEALAELPRFNGDQLVPERTGGDLSVQACADDPQVAFHAIRQLAALTYEAAELRWAISGFSSPPRDNSTPRNLMGFKDGTQRPANAEAVVWVGDAGPPWLRGGSYLVVRRIRIALEHWDRTATGFQEQTMGRHKYSGAPLGEKDEFAPLGLDREDADGNTIIPEGAHVRLASADSNDGAQILRRGYSYNEGVNFIAERWPPWRQAMEYDAGLLFVAYQSDPRTGFIRIFDRMSKLDMMNQYATHTGGGIFAVPPGAREGGYVGQLLFEAT